jgi:hypothetical protein
MIRVSWVFCRQVSGTANAVMLNRAAGSAGVRSKYRFLAQQPTLTGLDGD